MIFDCIPDYALTQEEKAAMGICEELSRALLSEERKSEENLVDLVEKLREAIGVPADHKLPPEDAATDAVVRVKSRVKIATGHVLPEYPGGFTRRAALVVSGVADEIRAGLMRGMMEDRFRARIDEFRP